MEDVFLFAYFSIVPFKPFVEHCHVAVGLHVKVRLILHVVEGNVGVGNTFLGVFLWRYNNKRIGWR